MSPQVKKTLSDRHFGFAFAVVFTVIGLIVGFSKGFLLWPFAIALGFLITALLLPSVLAPLNRLWQKFGMLMHRIINPILMALVFFLTVLPTGLMLRLFGKDPMRRKLDTKLESYWLMRDSASIDKTSFDNQF